MPSAGSTTTSSSPLARVNRSPSSLHSARRGGRSGAGAKPGPAEPGHRRLAGEQPADRRLVDEQADLGVRAGREPADSSRFDLLDGHALAGLGADDQR